MRDKNCFNCGNDHACVNCVCFNKWESRPASHKVEPFYLESFEINKSGVMLISDMMEKIFDIRG